MNINYMENFQDQEGQKLQSINSKTTDKDFKSLSLPNLTHFYPS